MSENDIAHKWDLIFRELEGTITDEERAELTRIRECESKSSSLFCIRRLGVWEAAEDTQQY